MLIWSAACFLLVIGPLVFIHEMGHYLVGRWCGVKAETFSIGFGRELIGWTDRLGTRWKVSLLPLGGYVKFAGDMGPASAPSPEWLALPAAERARTFQAKRVWQRFLIVLAGPATNFLFAYLVLAGILLAFGEPVTPPVIATVVPHSAAAAAGLKPGDRIVAIDGMAIRRFEDIATYTLVRPDTPMAIRIERDHRLLKVAARTGAMERHDEFGNSARTGVLGIGAAAGTVRPVPVAEVPGRASAYVGDAVRTTIVTLRQIVTGTRSVKEMSGPVGVARIAGEQATLGWFALILLMAGISINLGFINLLPVPMLDGGHLFFYLVEAVRRKPVEPAVQEWAFRSGLALLLGLMLLVTVNDLGSAGLWQRLAGLIS
ncbi:RIP metalloprotease RseP [Sphingomonas morindae]|uniref:Zinc metalloprotease n=1 Tax=Sphingomonas morindae TaxID=1541170 RepID=A0ABY4XD47_9SPHN|nr:RIP metalloprotease RseP [Sphingomonas morindae]USI74600.1 RIP metalloprotease RseP [Sphingomonas morindae]